METPVYSLAGAESRGSCLVGLCSVIQRVSEGHEVCAVKPTCRENDNYLDRIRKRIIEL